jgi:hypothetical protein
MKCLRYVLWGDGLAGSMLKVLARIDHYTIQYMSSEVIRRVVAALSLPRDIETCLAATRAVLFGAFPEYSFLAR